MDLKELNYYYNKFKFGEDNFHELMKKRVNEILLVSTFYDAYIFEQDGRLSEQIHGEYMQLNLSTAPRITSVPTGVQALELLKTKKFDLVITMMRIGEISPFKLSKKIKKGYPDLPILLLLNVSNDVGLIDKESDEMKYIDNVFSWNGDSKIFLTMIKYVEDRWNVKNDTEIGHVRVVLLVEDSIHYYSMFHPLLYSEILKQTQRLISEELNDINKRYRMRGRPKVLLCHTFEEAINTYEQYKENVIAIISDIRYNYKGKIHPKAGIKLIRHMQMHNVECPILLQSSELENEKDALKLGVSFLNKNSKTLLHDLQKFILGNLGFGDFIFRDQDGNELDRAGSLEIFGKKLKTISKESLIFHSIHNHFSAWLTAHSEFLFSKRLKAINVDDFDDINDFRKTLIDIFKEVKHVRTRGKILKYDRNALNIEEGIIRLADGSFGGKARGLAFLNSLFVSMDIETKYNDVSIKIPKTFVIGTSEYDKFLENNNIGSWLVEKSDIEIKEVFVNCKISEELNNILTEFVEEVDYPIAVRSSGLLEDSQSQPFAGIYDTFMLPNNNIEDEIRLIQIKNAIKLVFASVFLKTARNYLESINYKLEEEKMAVIIQECVGDQFEGFYYPHFSGVGQSYNFYPTSYLKNSDGIVSLAAGLGKSIVEGGRAFRFSPKYPKMELLSQDELLGESQKDLYALDVQNKDFCVTEYEKGAVTQLKIRNVVKHRALDHLISTWDFENDRLVDGAEPNGPKIVTFADIIKNNYFPLAEICEDILEIGENAMGVPIEIEFAVNLNSDLSKGIKPTFYVLQIRPLTINTDEIYIDSDNLEMDKLFLYTSAGMGNGVISDINDVIFIDPDKFDRLETLQMKEEIDYLNKKMKDLNRQYILIGPGRWGSRDRFLGIPVQWHEINKAKIIVETGMKDFIVDASQGTHFFHNLISMNTGYFTVPYDSQTDFIDWEWLKKQPLEEKTKHFIHIQTDDPTVIKMDGRNGISFIYKT
ncbi:MAG: hypothetical protein HOB92_02600 [Candidatus Cloacimonetes bacterium]|nr:hypothetical protein [Candidatus Cloacimonadota bacterium]